MGLPNRLTHIRGCILKPEMTRAGFRILKDGILEVDGSGRFVSVDAAPASCELPVTRPGCVWLPGFVDTHLHFPQTRVIGTAAGPLLTWLAQSTYPEEQKFADGAYAHSVAELFCSSMAAQGTTSAAIYSSSDVGATETLFGVLDSRGLRGLVGLTLMDREAPEALCVSTDKAVAGMEKLISHWHEHDGGRLQVCVTPRFAISCTPELMTAAGEIARRYRLPVQTHISENIDEIETVRRLFPDRGGYLDVYDHFGLLTDRMILAHCIWLSDDEWRRVADSGARVSHCPDSNFFLGSGLFPWRKLNAYEVRLGLGSDVGAGRTYAMNDIASSAYDVALSTASDQTPAALVWYATRGGALAVGRNEVGVLEPSYECDLIGIDVAGAKSMNDAEIYDALLFRKNDCRVHTAIVRGKIIYQR